MAIVKNPIRKTTAIQNDAQAEAFIAKAGLHAPAPLPDTAKPPRKPTMIRIPPDLLTRIDAGAKRLGISRSAFIVLSSAEKLERIE